MILNCITKKNVNNPMHWKRNFPNKLHRETVPGSTFSRVYKFHSRLYHNLIHLNLLEPKNESIYNLLLPSENNASNKWMTNGLLGIWQILTQYDTWCRPHVIHDRNGRHLGKRVTNQERPCGTHWVIIISMDEFLNLCIMRKVQVLG